MNYLLGAFSPMREGYAFGGHTLSPTHIPDTQLTTQTAGGGGGGAFLSLLWPPPQGHGPQGSNAANANRDFSCFTISFFVCWLFKNEAYFTTEKYQH